MTQERNTAVFKEKLKQTRIINVFKASGAQLELLLCSWGGRAEDGCKAVQAALEGEGAQYLLFHPHQGRNFGLRAGGSPRTDSP